MIIKTIVEKKDAAGRDRSRWSVNGEGEYNKQEIVVKTAEFVLGKLLNDMSLAEAIEKFNTSAQCTNVPLVVEQKPSVARYKETVVTNGKNHYNIYALGWLEPDEMRQSQQKVNVAFDGDECVKVADCENEAAPEKACADSECDYVDLGLPSGTLWATKDIGAKALGEEGDTFMWGMSETNVENTDEDGFYTAKNYKFCTVKVAAEEEDDDEEGFEEVYYTKYCTDEDDGRVDHKTKLEPEDDTATVLWGKDWCMPTKKQAEELINCCEHKKEGNTMVFVGPNGKKLVFSLDFSDCESQEELEDSCHFWWTSELDVEMGSGYVSGIQMDGIGEVEVTSSERCCDSYVRPVKAVSRNQLNVSNIVAAVAQAKEVQEKKEKKAAPVVENKSNLKEIETNVKEVKNEMNKGIEEAKKGCMPSLLILLAISITLVGGVFVLA